MGDHKLTIRPIIKHIGPIENKSREEQFQNLTLRPILKMQHELLMAFFENYLSKRKINFAGLGALKRNELVSKIFKIDQIFKAE